MVQADGVEKVAQVPLREAKAQFSMLVSRAELLDEVTVLTKHGRAAAAIVPVHAAVTAAAGQAGVAELWELLDRVCPPGRDAVVDEARLRAGMLSATVETGPGLS